MAQLDTAWSAVLDHMPSWEATRYRGVGLTAAEAVMLYQQGIDSKTAFQYSAEGVELPSLMALLWALNFRVSDIQTFKELNIGVDTYDKFLEAANAHLWGPAARSYFEHGITTFSDMMHLHAHQVTPDDVFGYHGCGITKFDEMIDIRQGTPAIHGFHAKYLHSSGITEPAKMREALQLCQHNGATLHEIIDCRERLNNGVLGVLSPRLLAAHPVPLATFELLQWKTDLIPTLDALDDIQLRNVVRLAEDNRKVTSEELLALVGMFN